ncbi:MAG: hypothetical protein ABSH52_21540 [Terriglobia bacterium]|jgi:hypothetical protein
MPLFMCRWENGDCSFVGAPTKDVAIQCLDEVGNADGSQLTALRDFMVHFELTSEGKLRFHSFGELTEEAIFEKAYPLLDDLLDSERLRDAADPTSRDLALIRATVAKERKRLQGKKPRKLAQTEVGRSIAKEMDAPASLMDTIVRQVAGEKLKNLHPRGKPH